MFPVPAWTSRYRFAWMHFAFWNEVIKNPSLTDCVSKKTKEIAAKEVTGGPIGNESDIRGSIVPIMGPWGCISHGVTARWSIEFLSPLWSGSRSKRGSHGVPWTQPAPAHGHRPAENFSLLPDRSSKLLPWCDFTRKGNALEKKAGRFHSGPWYTSIDNIQLINSCSLYDNWSSYPSINPFPRFPREALRHQLVCYYLLWWIPPRLILQTQKRSSYVGSIIAADAAVRRRDVSISFLTCHRRSTFC